MPPKRAGQPSSCQKTKKMPKLTNKKAVNVKADLEQAVTKQMDELEQAFNQELQPRWGIRTDSTSRIEDPRVLHLAGEIARTPALPPTLTMRLLQFCVKANTDDVARDLLENQTIDLKTPEGGELLWQAIDEGHPEVAIVLVRHGADLSVRKGDCSLLHAVLRPYKFQYLERPVPRHALFRLMLDLGADIDALDSLGHSVLHAAIVSKYSASQLVEELLDRGARVWIDTTHRRREDDLYWACKNVPELVPRLVEHRVADEETRNQRGKLAVEYLIEEDYAGARLADAMKVVGKLLDLGVPVDVPDSQREKRKFSFLNTALFYKRQAAIKLLLEYGADPHQTNLWGHTTLYQATTFKGYTHVSRLLIERGVSIHARNEHGRYPIHGACYNKSVRNIHLLLNLGADLNATDDKGCTPFGLVPMKETVKDKEPHYLIIKHFALIEARGGKISNADMTKTMQWNWSANHFDKCTKQLERMKKEKAYGNVTYFLLLSRNIYGTVQLMKNRHFLESFKKNQKKLADLFPEYFYMLLHSFEIAGKRLEVLLTEKKELHEVFLNAVPDHIVERITYYLHFEKLERCQHDYYMSFHASLKYNQADKAKIL